MPTPLTTNVSKTITQYEVTAGNLDFVGQTVTIQVNLLDVAGAVVETKTFTKSFTELGLAIAQANIINTAIVNRLKTDGVVN